MTTDKRFVILNNALYRYGMCKITDVGIRQIFKKLATYILVWWYSETAEVAFVFLNILYYSNILCPGRHILLLIVISVVQYVAECYQAD